MLKNFSFVIEDKLAASAMPGGWGNPHADIEELSRKNIKAIVTLTEETLNKALIKEYNIEYFHLPIKDFTPPEIEQIIQFITFVDKCIKNNKPVLVHCWAGIGRTGTMLAAYFISKGYTADKAIRHVRNVRFGSIETREQEERLYEFEIYWNNMKDKQ